MIEKTTRDVPAYPQETLAVLVSLTLFLSFRAFIHTSS